MLNFEEISHWSIVINLMIQSFFQNGTTICILWNKEIQWQLCTEHYTHAFVNLNNEAYKNLYWNDTKNNQSQQLETNRTDFGYNELVSRLAVAIEINYCEGFMAFQNDIPYLSDAFSEANLRASWHSLQNQFLFSYFKSEVEESAKYFQNRLLSEQPDVLVVEAEAYNSCIFELKTNEFHQVYNETLQQLNWVGTVNTRKIKNLDHSKLKQMKLNNLHERKIIVGAFDYRPFVALDYQMQPQMYDHAADNPSNAIHADGTEMRVLKIFCEIHNCSLEFDSTEKDDWAGLIALLEDNRIDIGMGAFYDFGFKELDFTAFLGRSGVTCLVPAPNRLVSWQLPLLPFQSFVWLCLIVLVILEILSLCATKFIGQSIEYREKSQLHENLSFASEITLKLIVSQSTKHIITQNSLRFLLLSCYMIDIILTSTYGAGLAAVLTLPTLDKAADSVERMAEFNLKWTAQSELWLNSIKEVKDPILERVVRNYHVSSVDEMREKAKLGTEGFIVERLANGHFGNVDYMTETALDKLKLMVDDLYFQYTGVYVRRSWALEEAFNQFIYWYHSGGFTQYWESKIAADYMNKIQQGRIEMSKIIKLEKGPVKLDSENFAGIIIIWLVGIGLSILVFIIEFLGGKIEL